MRMDDRPVCLGDERGAALFITLLGLMLLSTILVGVATLGRGEALIARNSVEQAQAAFAAEAGANHARWLLAQRLRVDLARQVADTSRGTLMGLLRTTYNSPAGAARFLLDLAQGAGANFVRCTTGGCAEPPWSPVGEIPDDQQVVLTLQQVDPAYTVRIVVGVPPLVPPVVTNGGTGAVFTYVWRIESTGTSGRASETITYDSVIASLPTGTFTVALNANFVQYAHFIEQMGASDAWLSARHVYTGPVHTNTRFNIAGDPRGPVFRSGATQRYNDTRFFNGGSPIIAAKDSTDRDWPLLGAAPGVYCKTVDCTGFTRNYDFEPSTAAVDPVPLPTGGNSPDRQAQLARARGPDYPCPCEDMPVWVANTRGRGAGGTINGGIYVEGSVRDLQLAATATGQRITIYTSATRRTVIQENRPLNQTIVRRECQANTSRCGGGSGWILDEDVDPASARLQVLSGLLSPNPETDFGVIFVDDGIGVAGTTLGLRREPGAGVTAAVDRDTRLTIAADSNIYIAGHLDYLVDPRGPDGVFASPTPGAGDDDLGVQNVLGIVSWRDGIHLSSALTGDLRLHALIMVPAITGGGAPDGQLSFDDPNGLYRGVVRLLGGVVQKTMGVFGTAGSPGTGYARDWVYDERARHRGLGPPVFPGFPNFTASTSLGVDSYTWRAGGVAR
jgi:hypothetical protein